MKSLRKFIIPLFALLLVSAGNLYAMDWHGWHYYFVNFNKYKNGKVIDAQPTPDFNLGQITKRDDALRFFAFGCFGTGNGGQKIVSEEMARFGSHFGMDFSILLGDNFYPWGVKSIDDPQWVEKFESIYPREKFNKPFYAVLGNHDYHRNPNAQIDYSEQSDRWHMPSHYYSFSKQLADGTHIEFFGLDTTPLAKAVKKDPAYWRSLIMLGNETEGVRAAKQQLMWLRDALKKSNADWKIVFGHAPLYSGDAKRGEEAALMREILLPIFSDYKVNLYLSAHAHTIELMKPVNGVHFVVSGAASRPRKKLYWTEDTLFASADLSYAWLQVSSSSIDVAFMGEEQDLMYLHQIRK